MRGSIGININEIDKSDSSEIEPNLSMAILPLNINTEYSFN